MGRESNGIDVDLLEAADQLNAASQNADVLKLVKLYPAADSAASIAVLRSWKAHRPGC